MLSQLAAALLLVPLLSSPNASSPSPCEMRLTSPAPVPGVGANGRPDVEPLTPQYGTSYQQDPVLSPAVRLYRQWQWKSLYSTLDAVARQQPQHLDTFRLQADTYLVNGSFDAALGQLDQVLRREPRDVHALMVTSLIQTFQANTMDAACRLTHLRRASPPTHERLVAFLQAVDRDLTTVPTPTVPVEQPDAIVVFGRPANADGTVPVALQERLEGAVTWAREFPQAHVMVSGGPVRNPHAEADVMAEWLIARGVAETRIVRDTQARDTVGNALAMADAAHTRRWSRVIAVTSKAHLPRAVATLRAAAHARGWPLVVDAVGTGTPPAPNTLPHERKYTFVTAARAARLWEKNDVVTPPAAG